MTTLSVFPSPLPVAYVPPVEPAVLPSITEEQYIRTEGESEFKREFLYGHLYMMAGGQPEHSLIPVNVSRFLYDCLEACNCRVYNSDMRVRIPGAGYVYPDLVIVCGKPKFDDAISPPSLLNPTVVMEVLSESSVKRDLIVKRKAYSLIPSLHEMLLVDSRSIWVSRYVRQADGLWREESWDRLTDSLTVNGCPLTVRDVYRGVELAE